MRPPAADLSTSTAPQPDHTDGHRDPRGPSFDAPTSTANQGGTEHRPLELALAGAEHTPISSRHPQGGQCATRARLIRRDSVEEWAASWRAMARLVPTLAIAGAQDLSAVPEALQAIANGVPGAQYVLVDPGTHMMPMEQPEALASSLLQFRHDVDTATFGG